MLVNERGFTLIEAMIVLSILVILGSLAAPSFRQLMATTRVKAIASDIHLSLTRARSEAIKRNTSVTVAATDDNWSSGWTVSGGIETHGAVDPGISISGTTSITYGSNGRPSSSSIGVNLNSAETYVVRCVTVTLGGHPTIKESACP